MADTTRSSLSRMGIYILVVASGLAMLSWEVIWQIKSSLALGMSARGTALTLAVTMGGMSIGSLLVGQIFKDKQLKFPLRIYGALEIIIGIAGLCLGGIFWVIEKLDSLSYAVIPDGGSFVHILGITLALGIPSMCMGGTLPIFGLIAKQSKSSIAVLYGLNTLGAAAGALLAAFLFIPLFGVSHTASVTAAINIGVGLVAWAFTGGKAIALRQRKKKPAKHALGSVAEQTIVIVTGFATFALEVSWFRSLTAAFQNTTAAFAIMLASVLIALGLAASFAPTLKKMKISLGVLISCAGVFILLATPLIERLDLFLASSTHPADLMAANTSTDKVEASSYVETLIYLFIIIVDIIGVPMLLLGLAFPWIMDDQHSARRWGKLYALNTLAAILGSIGAAWLLLPNLGFARTAWIAGVLVSLTGIVVAPRKKRALWILASMAAMFLAGMFESGVGTSRVQGAFFYLKGQAGTVLESFQGPDASVAVVGFDNGSKRLIIDGSSASGQSGKDGGLYEHYMAWMGHLPMLLHPDPKNALVICFGTGQTANAVRKENPEILDIVDINPHIYDLAHNFSANENVLGDPRVAPIVMDGRAFLRRVKTNYDVITLEPMPPILAGVNDLYSREFYRLARARLTPQGVIAQWLPFHAVSPYFAASIARTFQETFPNAILWIDEASQNGILLGSRDDDDGLLGKVWPGYQRQPVKRNMQRAEVERGMKFDELALERYGAYGDIITDDNQLLSFGNDLASAYVSQNLLKDNFDLLDRIEE